MSITRPAWIAAAIALAPLGLSPLGLFLGACATPVPVHAETPPATWGSSIVKQDAAWYASAEARRIADTVILYQSPEGGFPKNTNLMVPPTGPIDPHTTNTFDNYGTTLPLEFLARVISAGGGHARAPRRLRSRPGLYVFGPVSERRMAPVLPPARRILRPHHL